MVDDISGRMHKARVSYCVAVGVLLTATAGVAQDQELEKIEVFRELCTSNIKTVDGVPFVEAKFGRLKQRSNSSISQRQPGTWPYVYEQYSNNRYVFKKDTGGRIHLVSFLHRPKRNEDLPDYLWHVISVPNSSDTDRAERHTGSIAEYERFRKTEKAAWDKDKFRTLRNSTQRTQRGNTVLTYVNRGLGDATIRSIRRIWIQTFRSAMEDLVVPSHVSSSTKYTHLFVYQNVPQEVKSIIRKIGDRRDSNRRVLAPGKAYGFVLNDAGDCLAWTTLEMVLDSSQ